MKERIKKVMEYILDRLGEQSTWQGVGFVVALTGSKLGLGMEWGQAASLGGLISAVIKMMLPDPQKDTSK